MAVSRSIYFRYILVGLAGIALTFAILAHSHHSDGLVTPKSRKPVPPLTLTLLDGQAWKLSDHRGQVVAINYWASWCVPCWEETPMLMHVSRDFGVQGFAVIGVAMDERDSNEVPLGVSRFLDTLHVTYPVAMIRPMSQVGYRMDGLPTTLLIDRSGRLARTYVGAVRERVFRLDVERLLKEPGD
jgi:cytochrome c biogenesis protein CcmG/thiol:disulfide interchange protein DsbE